MGTEAKQFSPEGNDHPTARDIGEWLGGGCPAAVQGRLRRHFIHCAECREDMVMIRQATQPQWEIEPAPDFERLLRLGERAAEEALRRHQMSVRAVAQAADQPRWRQWFTFRQPALRWAAVAVLLLAIGIPVYRFYQNNQPVERAMGSLRQSWNQNRPLEARVTGEFPYLPYQLTRGKDTMISVNQGRLLAATAELAREVADRPTPRARHALGRLHLLKEEFVQAEEQLKLVIKEEPKNALAHVDLASVYYERGVREGSPPLLFQAADYLKTATSISPKLPEAWFNLALCHERMELRSQAKTDWEHYLELDSTSPWAAEARDHLQKLRDRAGMSTPQPSKLAGELLAADMAGDEAKIRASLAENFTEVSTVTWEYFLDNYLEASSSDNRAKADQLGHVLTHLAQLIRETKADAYFLDQFNSVKGLNAVWVGKVKEVRALLAQGDLAHKNGEYDKGVAFFSQALSAAERIGDVCHTEKAMFGLARTYTPQTETPRMSAIRQHLVGVTSRRQHRQMQAKALLALGNQYMAETKYSQVLEAGYQAYEICRLIGDVDTSVNSLKFIGSAYDRLGKTDEVFKSFFTALRMLRANSVNLLRDCQIYTHFSSALADRKHYQEALDYQLEALAYCRQCNDLLFASAQGRAWKYIILTGQSEQAISLLQDASFGAGRYNEATGMHSMLFDLYISLGDGCLKQKQSVEAAAAYQNALKLRGQNQPFHTQFTIYHGLALAYLQQRKNDEAETALNKSIELAEQARENINEIDNRSAFTSSRKGVYQTMVEFQYSIKKSSGRAFDYAEIYRARELFDVISQHKGVQWDSARKTIEVSGISTPKTVNQVQKSLPADVQIVEYAFTEQNLLIWVVTASRLETVSVPLDRERFQTVVAGYLTAIKQREAVNSLNVRSRELYQLLIRPVESYLSKACIQVFVPDGMLKAIPFAALVSPVTNRYLAEDYALAVSPSASILAQLITQREIKQRAAESLLMVSNPRYSQKLFPGLKPLPGTDEEMANLRSFYPSLRQLAGEKATKKALLELIGQYAVVHLATHSFLDEETPLSSAIVLAASAASATAEVKESGILQAHEILQLKLPETRLVILSSCHSAASAPEKSDGPATLAQAFFSAGVPAVIGSLWEVDDASTAKLMTAFHRAYRVDKLNPCQALRQSQLTLLSAGQGQWKHPYYWAAFLLSGNGFSS